MFFAGAPTIGNKSNFKFKTLRWRPLRWRLTLSDSRQKRQENGTESEKLRRLQNTTDSGAVLFLAPKGPLGLLVVGTFTGKNPPRWRRRTQKTREGCGCFWGLCRSSGGKFRENSRKIAGKIFPNRQMQQILGFRAPRKANLPGTLGPHCRDLVPTFRAGCFLKLAVPAFSSLSAGHRVGSSSTRCGSMSLVSFPVNLLFADV